MSRMASIRRILLSDLRWTCPMCICSPDVRHLWWSALYLGGIPVILGWGSRFHGGNYFHIQCFVALTF
jgi:hypothetical protein